MFLSLLVKILLIRFIRKNLHLREVFGVYERFLVSDSVFRRKYF